MANINWQERKAGELADHIIVTHHDFTKRKLALITNLLEETVRSSWMKHPSLFQAHSIYYKMKADLTQHFIMEETAGFPAIKKHDYDKNVDLSNFKNTINGHLDAHASVLKDLASMKTILWGHNVPSDVSPIARDLIRELQALEIDLTEHIRLENDVLFKMI